MQLLMFEIQVQNLQSIHLLEKISAVYKDNDMESIQTYPRREGERFYTLALQFGKEDKYTYSNTALSDEQLEALAGIRDLILERIGQ